MKTKYEYIILLAICVIQSISNLSLYIENRKKQDNSKSEKRHLILFILFTILAAIEMYFIFT